MNKNPANVDQVSYKEDFLKDAKLAEFLQDDTRRNVFCEALAGILANVRTEEAKPCVVISATTTTVINGVATGTAPASSSTAPPAAASSSTSSPLRLPSPVGSAGSSGSAGAAQVVVSPGGTIAPAGISNAKMSESGNL